MAITHASDIRNALCDYVVDAVDRGAGAGKVIFMTSSDVTVATATCADPAFGSASGGTATANPLTSLPDAIGGEVSKFKVVDSNGATIFQGSAGLSGSGADAIISNTTIGAGETVTVNSLSYTAPL